jgi:hypothetical protein
MREPKVRSRPRAGAVALCALAVVAAVAVASVKTSAGSGAGILVTAAPIAPVAAGAKAPRVLPRLYTADLALGIVAGYAFADGQIQGGTYTYEMGGDGLADQFRAAILDAGGTVVPRGEYGASSSGLRDLGLSTHGALMSGVLNGPADLRRGVITGIIQCEGDPTGLVWDGPSRPAAESVVTLLASLGVTARVRGTQFFDVVVGPESFPFFQSLPVALRERLPGS